VHRGGAAEFYEDCAIWDELKSRPYFRGRLIHTGQHASPEMSDAFFRDLGLPQPDQHLGIGPGSEIAQAAAVMTALEVSVLEDRPDLVLVVGDVTSTLAAALVAATMQIPLAHVEAGLRSFDRSMPRPSPAARVFTVFTAYIQQKTLRFRAWVIVSRGSSQHG
jgi:UDP-N-acetylglucosamine 2-epimerase (non-hydrolysing)